MHKSLLGITLIKAGLINVHQLEVALLEQQVYPDLRLGEILCLHGWISPKTVNFIADHLSQLQKSHQRLPLGQYLLMSGLVTYDELSMLLSSQTRYGLRLGDVAAAFKLVSEKTIQFFLQHQASILPHYRLVQPKTNEQKPFRTTENPEISWVG